MLKTIGKILYNYIIAVCKPVLRVQALIIYLSLLSESFSHRSKWITCQQRQWVWEPNWRWFPASKETLQNTRKSGKLQTQLDQGWLFLLEIIPNGFYNIIESKNNLTLTINIGFNRHCHHLKRDVSRHPLEDQWKMETVSLQNGQWSWRQTEQGRAFLQQQWIAVTRKTNYPLTILARVMPNRKN